MQTLNPSVIIDDESVNNVLENQGTSPIESPEIEMETNGEGTRETIEPITGSKMVLSVYPNPTTEYFTIELGGEGQFLLEMYDGQGRQVKIAKLTSSSTRIDASNLEPGSYFLRISNSMGDQVETKTVIVL